MVNENINGIDILIPDDCDNAPRRLTLVNIYKAIASKDEEFIADHIMSDVVWDLIAEKKRVGTSETITYFNELVDTKMIKIEINTVLTHGRYGAVNGCFIFKEKPSMSFCDMYTFSSAAKSGKVISVASYVIKKE